MRPLSICAIFKNEAPYLREWIEFHRLVGVARFHLYQNNSTDDWGAVLAPYVDGGIVEVVDWPMPPPSQLPAYQDFIDRRRGGDEWVAFIDCDEFLFSPRCDNLCKVLADDRFCDCGAVGVNWMCFGAGGQHDPSPAPVIERFITRPRDDFPPNAHIKSILRMDRVHAAGGSPHCFILEDCTVSEDGNLLEDSFHRPPTHRRLRINHYFTKSRREFALRRSGPRADNGKPRDPSDFEGYQSADVHDTTIWRFLPALKSKLAAPSSPEDLAP